MTTAPDFADVWTRAISDLSETSLTAQQRAFVTLTSPLGLVGDTALVAAPNEFTKDVLETRLRPLVVNAISELLGQPVRLAVTVDPSLASALDDETDVVADATYAEEVVVEEPTRPGAGSPSARPGAIRAARARR